MIVISVVMMIIGIVASLINQCVNDIEFNIKNVLLCFLIEVSILILGFLNFVKIKRDTKSVKFVIYHFRLII
jgi:phage-related protein